MAISNYTELKASIANFLARDDLSSDSRFYIFGGSSHGP